MSRDRRCRLVSGEGGNLLNPGLPADDPAATVDPASAVYWIFMRTHPTNIEPLSQVEAEALASKLNDALAPVIASVESDTRQKLQALLGAN